MGDTSVNFKFDFQGLISAATIIVIVTAFAYSLRADNQMLEAKLGYIEEKNKEDRAEIMRTIWAIDRKLNEITKTVVK